MLLTANPSYLTAAQFKAMVPATYLTGLSDPQIQDICNRASGKADAIMKRSLLAKERTLRFIGDGTNKLELNVNPLLYVKRVQIVVPGTSGMYIPTDQLLFDFRSGSVLEYTPMMWNNAGYFAQFPKGVPIDITLGQGYGFAFSAPSYATSDGTLTGLTPGTYNVAITTQTMWGETSAVIRQVTTASGSILITPNPTLGAYILRGFISSAANNTTLTAPSIAAATSFSVASVGTIAPGDVLLFGANAANAEYLTVATASAGVITTTTGAVNAHSSADKVLPQLKLASVSPFTAYGGSNLSLIFSALTPSPGMWQDVLPLSDTSSPVLPYAVQEATRLLALSMIWEDNNPSNQGIYLKVSGDKRTAYRSTEGTSGKGVPLPQAEAMEYLRPYMYQAIL